ncbi:hypothetical protein BN1080_01569 [Planococcus massiliensis]|uniref:Lysozyme inhibitor LprI-like N-terminal domain-containing protein n=1 Tax=Planococcus massiliensis TaxID=1499687 RepID=A0A098EK21_9BACL|nr:lysozyme inhibitor LprI family protein [Planococcus massiliensis]CEG22638.1 hypothetical protein BN1080_01569 [Planococcus massiliensis]
MKKMIYLFVALGVLSGCTTIGKEAVPSEEEPPAETAELAEEESAPSLPENQSMERETVEENPKAYYLLELERIDLTLAKLENSYKNGSTAALKAGEAESLRRWDKALNEIYSVIRSQLSSEEMEELRLKQLDWISARDQQAAEAAAEFADGTLESVAQLSTVRELTKERCFFLVNTYLKEDAI